MTTDLWLLFWSAVLAIVHISVQSFAFKHQAGNAYSMGSRDEKIEATGLAGRLERAQRNFQESFAVFVVVVVVAHISGSANWLTAIGAHLYFWCRVLYLPAYGLTIPYVRTGLWQISMIGVVLIMSQIQRPLFD